MIIEWNETLETGIQAIDEQHKKLVSLLNELYLLSNNSNKKEKEELYKKFLEELEDYINYHFTFEENFMKEIGYPEFEAHKKVHETFKKTFLEKKQKYLEGDLNALREILAFTLSWIYLHISRTDKKYVKYLKESS